jgi:hypothetical protein
MTPREKLLRLALVMPDAGVQTICNSITWICPGIDDPTRPVMVRDRAELLEALGSIIHDKALREQFAAEIGRLKANYVPSPTHDNVVSLFGEVAG